MSANVDIIGQRVEWEQKPGLDTLSAICRAGKTCYKAANIKTKEKIETFIKGLIKRGHESVIEHSLASFRIICSRGLMAELTRHRLAQFSIESTRYCNYNKKGFTVITPDWLGQGKAVATKAWIDGITNCFNTYDKLINEGIPPEYARGVLPLDLKTEIVMSANLREWRHIVKLRTSKEAHPQIQRLVNDIKNMFLDSAVSCVFEDL